MSLTLSAARCHLDACAKSRINCDAFAGARELRQQYVRASNESSRQVDARARAIESEKEEPSSSATVYIPAFNFKPRPTAISS